MRDWFEKLLHIDRRIIYACVAAAIAIPLIRPLNFPVVVSQEVRDFYSELEKLKAGDVVLFSFDYEPDTMAELNPMSKAVLRHCFRKDVKVISTAMYPGAVGIAENILPEIAAEYGRKYGSDYVFLGYLPDWSATMLRIGEDILATYPADQHGRSTREMEIFRNVKNYDDIDLLVSISSSAYSEYWAFWAGGRYGQKIISGNTAVQAVLMYPYYQTRQVLGFLGGLKGAAEYEKLIGIPGNGLRGMDAQSTAHVLMVVFIIIGNIGYIFGKRRRKSPDRPTGTG